MMSGILLERRIKGEAQMQGMNIRVLSTKVGISNSRLYQLLKEPEKMDIGLFIRMCKALHLDPAEVLNENILYRSVKK